MKVRKTSILHGFRNIPQGFRKNHPRIQECPPTFFRPNQYINPLCASKTDEQGVKHIWLVLFSSQDLFFVLRQPFEPLNQPNRAILVLRIEISSFC